MYLCTLVCTYVQSYVCLYLTCLPSVQCLHLDSKLENMIGTLRSEVSAHQEVVTEGGSSKKVPCMWWTALGGGGGGGVGGIQERIY